MSGHPPSSSADCGPSALPSNATSSAEGPYGRGERGKEEGREGVVDTQEEEEEGGGGEGGSSKYPGGGEEEERGERRGEH